MQLMQYGFCKAIDHFQEKELAKAIGIATVALAFSFSTKLPCRGGLGEANWIRNEPVTLMTTLKHLLFRVSLTIATGNEVREQHSL